MTVRPVLADPVIEWNRIAKTAIVDNAGKPATTGAVILAYMHGAIYDAVNATNGRFAPFAWRPWRIDRKASQEAAIVSAAYHILVGLFPTQGAYLDREYAAALAGIPEGDSRDRGIAIGQGAAFALLAHRAGDGFEAAVSYTPGSGPGAWQPTPPASLPAMTPWVARLRPFTLTSPSQFRAEGPPTLGSAQWAADYNEIKAYGAAVGSLRTPAQTEMGRFWTEHPIAQYTRIWRDLATARGLNLLENARFFAMVSVTLADAFVAVWDSKYYYGFWRPVTAIRAGDTDGNSTTAPDAIWTPAQVSPNHPEYPGAHGTCAGAISKTIEQFFGTNRVTIVLSSAVTGTSHTIDNTDDLAQELIDARVYGGMHYRTSSEHGAALGRKVADWVSSRFFHSSDR